MNYPNQSLEDLQNFIQILKNANKRVFFLSGPMGSGKTTFVKYYFSQYIVSSPTYTTYNAISQDILHFDLFLCNRLPLELLIALLDKIVFIEWWEKWPFEMFEKYLDQDYCFINMKEGEISLGYH